MVDAMVKPAQNQSKDAPTYRAAPNAPNQTNSSFLSSLPFGWLQGSVDKALAPRYAEGTANVPRAGGMPDPYDEGHGTGYAPPVAPYVDPSMAVASPTVRNIPNISPNAFREAGADFSAGNYAHALGAATRGQMFAPLTAAAGVAHAVTDAAPRVGGSIADFARGLYGSPTVAASATPPSPAPIPASKQDATHSLLTALGADPAHPAMENMRGRAPSYPGGPTPSAPQPEGSKHVTVTYGNSGRTQDYVFGAPEHAAANPHMYQPDEWSRALDRVPVEAILKMAQAQQMMRGGYDPVNAMRKALIDRAMSAADAHAAKAGQQPDYSAVGRLLGLWTGAAQPLPDVTQYDYNTGQPIR